jgi:hypothetical protein
MLNLSDGRAGNDGCVQENVPAEAPKGEILLQTPLSPRPMPYIPLEISKLISHHLDNSSALNLMSTCCALSHAGEMKVYSMLNVVGSWDGECF